MVVTVKEASPFTFSFQPRKVPQIVQFRHSNYYYGCELGSYSRLAHGELYRNTLIALSRIKSKEIRAELKIAVILIL